MVVFCFRTVAGSCQDPATVRTIQAPCLPLMLRVRGCLTALKSLGLILSLQTALHHSPGLCPDPKARDLPRSYSRTLYPEGGIETICSSDFRLILS
jgi:hypothetical protein